MLRGSVLSVISTPHKNPTDKIDKCEVYWIQLEAQNMFYPYNYHSSETMLVIQFGSWLRVTIGEVRVWP